MPGVRLDQFLASTAVALVLAAAPIAAHAGQLSQTAGHALAPQPLDSPNLPSSHGDEFTATVAVQTDPAPAPAATDNAPVTTGTATTTTPAATEASPAVAPAAAAFVVLPEAVLLETLPVECEGFIACRSDSRLEPAVATV